MRQSENYFSGHRLTNKGMQADLGNISAICNMLSLTDVFGVKPFLCLWDGAMSRAFHAQFIVHAGMEALRRLT